jgi:hypothetical protein
MPKCTFQELRDILIGLGFEVRRVASTAIVFERREPTASLYLDPFNDEDIVDPATLAVVRRNLDERGILPRSQFEDLLRERSLAG